VTSNGTRIGLMLYTTREACAHDFQGTLREIAEMGYQGVEVFDLHEHEAAEVAAWLEELGLEACARHASLDAIEGQLPELAAEARTLGWRRVVVNWMDPSWLDERTLERLAAAAVAVADAGLQLGYHNHDAEVRTGFLDRLPTGVFLELDAGWAWWAGADPVSLLGRGPLVHIKDFRTRGERSFCPGGDGAVGYERLAPAAVRAGVEWLLVEQDEADGSSELDGARRSLGALTAMLEDGS
jgi:sugar phosphate isomerase/epimerase